MVTLIRRYSTKDGHLLKRPTKTSLFKFLHSQQIGNSPRLKTPKKELCQDCKQAEVTCECLECGKPLCEFCFNENHIRGICKDETKENENLPCDECTEPLPCDAENLEQCKKKRGVEEE